MRSLAGLGRIGISASSDRETTFPIRTWELVRLWKLRSPGDFAIYGSKLAIGISITDSMLIREMATLVRTITKAIWRLLALPFGQSGSIEENSSCVPGLSQSGIGSRSVLH